MTPIYDVRHVHRVFGKPPRGVHAVNDATFTLERGQRLGIVGESGSGKSTLARMLVALDRPTSGSILFDELAIENRRERDLADLRSRVQLVFQDPRSSLNPRMRVGAAITEPLRSPLLRDRPDVPSEHAARLAEVLAAVGLDPDMAGRFPHEFSGGQRQRIAIARALVAAPDVLIADEPVSALDVSVRAQVLNLLGELVAHQGLTLVFISHDLSVVRHLCDSVAVLRRGQIVEQGPIEPIYADPQHPYTRELLAAVPHLD